MDAVRRTHTRQQCLPHRSGKSRGRQRTFNPHRQRPIIIRNLFAAFAFLIPALALLAFGVDPTLALVLSQVVLSFGIPFALIPLVRLTADRALMGESVNRMLTTALAIVCAGLLIALNVTLLVLLAFGG